MNFKPEQLESFLQNLGNKVKCVIVFGNNEGQIATLQKKCAEAVCGSTDDAFRYVALEMEQISKEGSEIYAEYYAQSLMGGRRAVIIKNGDNNLAPIIKDIVPKTNSENVLIIASTTLNTRSSLITWAKERDDVIIVGCYEGREDDIASATENMLKSKGLRADVPTLQLLCARLSPDSKLNQSEIDKLAIYMDGREQVTADDVRAAVSDVAGANMEDLCYFVAGGEILKAGRMFDRLIKQGEDAPTLIRQISYHFSKLLDCVAQAEQGSSLEEAIRNLRPPLMFYRKRTFMKQLTIWNRERLLSALKLLYDTERDCKTTNIPAEQTASYALLRLTGAAQKWLNKR